MRSGTEKRPNPHEAPLGRFLAALCRPATTRRRRVPKVRAEKFIHEPPTPRQKTRPSIRRSKRRARWLAARIAAGERLVARRSWDTGVRP